MYIAVEGVIGVGMLAGTGTEPEYGFDAAELECPLVHGRPVTLVFEIDRFD